MYHERGGLDALFQEKEGKREINSKFHGNLVSDIFRLIRKSYQIGAINFVSFSKSLSTLKKKVKLY